MKILIIPDVHGNWFKTVKYIKAHKYWADKVVLLGDYVDDFDISKHGLPMINGIKEVCSMAREEPEKFEILLGNHDYQYIVGAKYSGYNPKYRVDYQKVFMDNIDLFKIAVELDGWVFSHAGFSSTWCTKHGINSDIFGEFEKKRYGMGQEEWISMCVTERVNKIFQNAFTSEERRADLDIFEHTIGVDDYYGSGDTKRASPIWIRPTALLNDMHFPQQIVGHTETYFPPLYLKSKHNDKLIVIDSPGHDYYSFFDTEKPPTEFLTMLESERLQKRKLKEYRDMLSREGQSK